MHITSFTFLKLMNRKNDGDLFVFVHRPLQGVSEVSREMVGGWEGLLLPLIFIESCAWAWIWIVQPLLI